MATEGKHIYSCAISVSVRLSNNCIALRTKFDVCFDYYTCSLMFEFRIITCDYFHKINLFVVFMITFHKHDKDILCRECFNRGFNFKHFSFHSINTFSFPATVIYVNIPLIFLICVYTVNDTL